LLPGGATTYSTGDLKVQVIAHIHCLTVNRAVLAQCCGIATCHGGELPAEFFASPRYDWSAGHSRGVGGGGGRGRARRARGGRGGGGGGGGGGEGGGGGHPPPPPPPAPQASPYVEQALRPMPLRPPPQDAANLAQKLVSSYGLSDVGITTYAPPGEPPGFGRKAFEVAIDNIDADLFGRSAQVRCFLFCFSILSHSTWLYSSVLAGACCGASATLVMMQCKRCRVLSLETLNSGLPAAGSRPPEGRAAGVKAAQDDRQLYPGVPACRGSGAAVFNCKCVLL